MRSIVTAGVLSWAVALLGACSFSAAADERSFSAVLAEEGLAGISEWAATRPDDAGAAYAAGVSEALSAIEHVLQVRHATYSGELPLMPGGQVELNYNPDAEFDPAFVETAMLGALEHFEKADKALDRAIGRDFAIEIDLTMFWFDVDADGVRDDGEDALSQVGLLLGGAEPDDAPADMLVRFDSADADWLAAYVHLASASAEMVLSVDPTSAIRAVFEGNTRLEEVGALERDPFFGTQNQIDTLVVVLTALDGVPDKTRTRAALSHLKQMIVHNSAFWAAVEQETDNDKEWLPNANQISAFGVEVDAEMAANWQAVLAEVSDVLHGRKLLPHWRVGRGEEGSVGIDLESLLTDPGDFDLLLLLHGAGLAPHVKAGELVDLSSWDAFSRSTGGLGPLFALWLN